MLNQDSKQTLDIIYLFTTLPCGSQFIHYMKYKSLVTLFDCDNDRRIWITFFIPNSQF